MKSNVYTNTVFQGFDELFGGASRNSHSSYPEKARIGEVAFKFGGGSIL